MAKNRNIWEHPWNYKEGILISITILVLGFVLEYSTEGQGVLKILKYPYNIIFGISLIIFLVLASVLGRRLTVIQWLESIPAAISSISLLLFVSLFMGITMQSDQGAPEIIKRLGLSHIVSSWPYLFSNLFLLITLGLITIKNLRSFHWKKLGFIVSHIGLWIVLFGANFGSVQIERLQMEIYEGEITNTTFDNSSKSAYTMPFHIKLEDFILDEYNPKLALVNNKTGNLYQTSFVIADSGVIETMGDWQVNISEYIYSSAKAGNKYYFINEPGASPSVLVTATNTNGNIVEGWVSCGSFNRPYESLKLDDNTSLVMLFPEPKEFTSIIKIYEQNKELKEVRLEVNKPAYIKGWKIYQMSYDSDLGRWSRTSVIELIKDPWLEIVYTGIFLMLAGALYMFWMGSRRKMTTVNSKRD